MYWHKLTRCCLFFALTAHPKATAYSLSCMYGSSTVLNFSRSGISTSILLWSNCTRAFVAVSRSLRLVLAKNHDSKVAPSSTDLSSIYTLSLSSQTQFIISSTIFSLLPYILYSTGIHRASLSANLIGASILCR